MAPSPSSREPAPRIVVVEDDADDRELLSRQLRRNKVDQQVRFFADGRSALAFLQDNSSSTPFHNLIAIFLDLKLPGIGGVKLLREIRKMPQHTTTPVFIMTGSMNPHDFEDCRSLKVIAFLPKPMTFEVFSQALRVLPHVPTFISATPEASTQMRPD